MSNKIWAIISITVILIALSAFTWAWAQEAPEPSDWVKISAKPAIIPADGVSTSTIQVMVTWPNETELSGEPAANQTLAIWTTCGLLFEARAIPVGQLMLPPMIMARQPPCYQGMRHAMRLSP